MDVSASFEEITTVVTVSLCSVPALSFVKFFLSRQIINPGQPRGNYNTLRWWSEPKMACVRELTIHINITGDHIE